MSHLQVLWRIQMFHITSDAILPWNFKYIWYPLTSFVVEVLLPVELTRIVTCSYMCADVERDQSINNWVMFDCMLYNIHWLGFVIAVVLLSEITLYVQFEQISTTKFAGFFPQSGDLDWRQLLLFFKDDMFLACYGIKLMNIMNVWSWSWVSVFVFLVMTKRASVIMYKRLTKINHLTSFLHLICISAFFQRGVHFRILFLTITVLPICQMKSM